MTTLASYKGVWPTLVKKPVLMSPPPPLPTAKCRVLILHGWMSDASYKYWFLHHLGFKLNKPNLSDWSFTKACSQAQKEYDSFKPDVIVGSSRGAAAAMNIKTGRTPLILLAPAYKQFGNVARVRNPAYIIHGVHDNWVPIQDSERLVENSPRSQLLAVNDDHRLNHQARESLRQALQMALGIPVRYPAAWQWWSQESTEKLLNKAKKCEKSKLFIP